MRVCTDDRDLDCMSELGEALLQRHPDEPALHLLLANAVLFRGEDLAAAAPEYLAWAELAGSSPSRAELARLSWRFVAFRQRVRSELPSASLAAERRNLLDDLARFEPETGAEETHATLLDLHVRLTSDEEVTAAALRAVPRVLEIGDPAAIFTVALALTPGAAKDPLVLQQQRMLADALLDVDPAAPRFPAYLVLDARARPDPEAKRELRALLTSGLPPGVEDDAWTFYAGMHSGRSLPQDARDALVRIVGGSRRRNTTANAALILAAEDKAWGRHRAALATLEDAEARFLLDEHELAISKASILADMERHADALVVLQESLRRGGTDYRRWFHAAREHQLLGNEPEAVRLYQFYLAQLAERASGAMPFGPPAPVKVIAEEHTKVWYRIVEMHPAFFGRSGVRQFVELLALLAAGLLAAARIGRARAFLLPGALAAECVFFAGLVALRAVADGASVPALSWVWLGTASIRAFVLVSAGLYISALAGLPRHTRSVAGPAIAAGVAAIAGLGIGLTSPPLFVLEGMPGFARVAELGLAPERLAEVPALLVSALRVEAAGRLVWPALVLTALPTTGLFARPVLRLGPLVIPGRETIAVFLAALLCSAGSPGAFPLAVAGAAMLGLARIRWGAAVPFLLHAVFALSACAATALRT